MPEPGNFLYAEDMDIEKLLTLIREFFTGATAGAESDTVESSDAAVEEAVTEDPTVLDGDAPVGDAAEEAAEEVSENAADEEVVEAAEELTAEQMIARISELEAANQILRDQIASYTDPETVGVFGDSMFDGDLDVDAEELDAIDDYANKF